MNFDEMPQGERVSEDAALRIDPPHPGLGILEGCIGEYAARHGGARTVREAAVRLDVDCELLSQVIDGRRGIWPRLALRLEALGWGCARVWVEMQARYDLARERRRSAETAAKAVAQASVDVPGSVSADVPIAAASGS